MSRFVAVWVVLHCVMVCHAATIYVNNVNGRDAADGTTPQAAVATFKRAVGLLQPGDALDIANTGQPYRQRLLLNRDLGTPTHPLVIHGNDAVITGMVDLVPEKWEEKGNGLYAYPIDNMPGNLNPVLMAGDQLVPTVKNPKQLKPGHCYWQKQSLLFIPADKQQMINGKLRASLIDSGVAVVNASYITIRHLISEYHANDGFNFHGNVRGIILENVESRYNGDDGCSIHEDGQLTVRNSWFHHNKYGIEDVHASNSTYQNVLVENNTVGVHFFGGIHQLVDSVIRDNQLHSLRVTAGRPAGYLGNDQSSFMYDSTCLIKNVHIQGGKSGLLLFDRARAFMINSLITQSTIGVEQLKGSQLEMRNTVVSDCQNAELRQTKATYHGDANLLYPGRLIHDGKTLDLPAWQQATGMDARSVIKQPEFSQNTPVLAKQPIEKQTIGLTHDYSNQTDAGTQPQAINDTQLLQQMIDHAITNRLNKLTIVPGTYRIDQSLMIVKANDLHIDATDVKLIMTQWDTAIKVIQCSGLELSGLTVDYDPLPFSQGVVTSVADDGSSFQMKLDQGYPTLEQLGSKVHMHVFDPATRYWKADVWDMYVRKVESVGDDLVAVTPQLPETNLAIGDLIAMNIRKRNAMIITKAKGVNTFRDLTFLCSPGLVIVGRDCEDTQRFVRVVIKPGPKPDGATTARLMSSAADGVNFAYCRKGPILENCDFSFMGDDSVNVHGAMMPVVAVPDPRTLIIAKMYINDVYSELIRSGDSIRIMTADTFGIEQQANVLSIREHPRTLAFDVAQMQKAIFPQTVSHLASDQYTLFEIKLDQDHHAAAMQQVVDFPAINCPGYIIRNSYFHDHRARAMRLMGNDGLVEGNTIERIGQAAISYGAEMGFWAIAGWVDNLTIRNNTIIDVNRDKNAVGEGTMALGAICSFVRTNVKTNPYPGHSHIRILNNTINGSGTAGIHLYATDNATITGNTIHHVNRRSNSRTGAKWGLGVSEPIEFHGQGRKVITGNSVH